MNRYAAGIISCFLFFMSSANAGSSSGPVTHIYAHVGDVVMFAAGYNQSKPACSTVGDEWALSLATQTGRAMYALILSAHAQGKSIDVGGTNQCSAWGDREAPYYIHISQ